MKNLSLIATQCGRDASAGGLLPLLLGLVLSVFMIAAMWRVFTKADQPGWGCLIPFYNIYLMLQIAGKPGWWLLLMFIPLVNIIIMILTLAGIANNFGKGGGYVLGLIFLPFIFYPMLAFGDAQYLGSANG